MAEQEKIRGCFQRVFLGSDEGKIVLKKLEEFARVREAGYCEDARKESYLTGRRSVITEIWKWLKGADDE